MKWPSMRGSTLLFVFLIMLVVALLLMSIYQCNRSDSNNQGLLVCLFSHTCAWCQCDTLKSFIYIYTNYKRQKVPSPIFGMLCLPPIVTSLPVCSPRRGLDGFRCSVWEREHACVRKAQGPEQFYPGAKILMLTSSSNPSTYLFVFRKKNQYSGVERERERWIVYFFRDREMLLMCCFYKCIHK